MSTTAADDQSGASPSEVKPFELDEITIAELQAGMKSGKFTARSLVEKYQERIDAIDKGRPRLNSVIELNPDALSIADELDQERKAKGPRGPLHGIPVLIKDNIATADRMMTTAGSLALVGAKPPKDSFVAQRLRAAGAVILGKTNLSEWANIRSSHSTSGWSGRGGLTTESIRAQPKSLRVKFRHRRRHLREPGRDWHRHRNRRLDRLSVLGEWPCRHQANRRSGQPRRHHPHFAYQDTAGPMCRTVRDAAILLSALTGVDPDDAATAASAGKSQTDYAQYCDPDGLNGARIGVARKYFGFNDAVDALMEQTLDVLKKQGAILVDPADIETFGKFDETEAPRLDV